MELSNKMLQRLKDEELKVLIDFDKVCKQIGVNYTLSSGTLLGAVRNGGFIPWDDDIDVAMLRDDYNKFLEKGQSFLPDHLFIQTFETDKAYPYNFAKIRDTSTVLKEYATKTLNMTNGIFIDVFPIDIVSSNKLIRWFDNNIIAGIYVLKFSSTIEWAKNSRSRIRGLIRRALFPLARLIGTYRLNTLESYIRVKNNKKDNGLTYGDQYIIPPNRLNDTMLMPIDCFKNIEDIEFEGIKFKAMKNMDTYLTAIYGNYYELPPEDQRVPLHGYCELKFND
jgi:lipopolysaccharide cholinephosphotransferase